MTTKWSRNDPSWTKMIKFNAESVFYTPDINFCNCSALLNLGSIFSESEEKGSFFSVLGECEGRQSVEEGGRKPVKSVNDPLLPAEIR